MKTKVDQLSEQERETALEWRNLCFTLEGAQGQNLIDNCSCKYQFAKTYLVYGREEEQALAEVRQSAQQGNFNFFSERGIATKNLTADVAEVMMSDWSSAIASKKTSLADRFLRRFGEDIDVFLATPHNSSRLILAKRYDETDAMIQLAQWSHLDSDQAMMLELKNEVAGIKSSVNEILKQMKTLTEHLQGDSSK